MAAVAEMALAGKIGATIQVPESGQGDNIPAHAWLFGEDQGRYLITAPDADGLLEAADKAGVPAMRIGLTGGEGLSLLGGEGETALQVLRTAHERWLRDYMAAP